MQYVLADVIFNYTAIPKVSPANVLLCNAPIKAA